MERVSLLVCLMGCTSTGSPGTATGASDAACSALHVSQEDVDLTGARLGEPRSETVTVSRDCAWSNTDPQDLEFQWLGGDPWQIVSDFPPAASLSVGDELSITLTWPAEDYGEEDATIELRTPETTALVWVRAGTDPDQDGDGHDAVAAGGGDCDDTDAQRFPQDEEPNQDLVDEDCDGLVDEDFVDADAVRITEFLADPREGSSKYGEWLELSNETAHDLDLVGWVLSGDDGDRTTVGESLILPAGGRIVLGGSTSLGVNGGANVDLAVDGDEFRLDDEADTIALELDGRRITELSYGGSGWDLAGGVAMGLDPDRHGVSTADNPSSWCPASEPFGDGDLGTPGEANAWCDHIDHDGDGASVDDGDCDDGDATVGPDSIEVWDGIDNDCDGRADAWSEDGGETWLKGDSRSYIGMGNSLSAGDFDADGVADLLVGSVVREALNGQLYAGGVGLLEASAWSAPAGSSLDDYATFIFQADVADNYLATSGSRMGDLDGDGAADLVLGGDDDGRSSSGVAGVIVLSSATTGGALSPDDAWVTFHGAESSAWARTLCSFSDLDGDGLVDVVYGDYQASDKAGRTLLFTSDTIATGGDHWLSSGYDAIWTGSADDEELGRTIGVGDLDGDGHQDLLLSAPGAPVQGDEDGALYVLDGASLLQGGGAADELYTLRIHGASVGAALGDSAEPMVGDFDADNTRDLVLSSTAEEEVYLFYDVGSLSGTVSVSNADLTIINRTAAARFGHELALGDFDDDGMTDLAASAPDDAQSLSSTALEESGEVHLFLGRSLGSGSISTSSSDASLFGTLQLGFGAALIADDFDSDGASELVVAQPYYSLNHGRVILYDLN